MTATCPNGHVSAADDYCDTCGVPIPAAGEGSVPASAGAPAATPEGAATADAPESSATSPDSAETSEAAGVPAGDHACPNCGTVNVEGAFFCEACGYDFTTGAMPRGAEPAGSAHSIEGEGEGSEGARTGTPVSEGTGFEWVAEIWVDPDWYRTQEAEDPCPSPGLPTIVPLHRKSVLLGRTSTSRNTHPEIELSSDPGVSRRHAQLTTDGARWFVEDLGSSNGTFVGPASGPLPELAIAVGPKTELSDDDRLYVGAWTRVVVRRATPDEQTTYA